VIEPLREAALDGGELDLDAALAVAFSCRRSLDGPVIAGLP